MERSAAGYPAGRGTGMKWRPILRSLIRPKYTAEEMARLQHHVAAISQERDELKRILADAGPFAPPGHFYSPVPSQSDVEDVIDGVREILKGH